MKKGTRNLVCDEVSVITTAESKTQANKTKRTVEIMGEVNIKEEVRNLTIEEFWDKYSEDYDNEEGRYHRTYCKYITHWKNALMYIGDFYEDGIGKDRLVYSAYQHFSITKSEYFDKDGNYVSHNYSVCAMYEGCPVEYQSDAKMSDVFGAIYNEVKEQHLVVFNDMKAYIEDDEYDGEDVLSREFDTFDIDFIELYADRLGIEYYYDDCWRMHITKIEKVWI